MSPQRELGGEQALVHPPTHVGGSWDKALGAHKNVLGWIKSDGWAAGCLTDTARALPIVSDPHPNYFAAYG